MEFVNVAVRIRPQPIDSSTECNIKVSSNNPPTLTISDRQHFNFDHIFDIDSNQVQLFNELIRPMIDKFLDGYDCTVFAYGQTGAGKTYTMGYPQTKEENMGMINRTFKEIFNKINNNLEIYTEISLYEIYNEKVFDLLDNDKVPLPVKGFLVPDLKKVPVYDLTQAQELFMTASKNRKTGGTLQNSKSSRSHAIYTLYCKISNGETVRSSKFNFVDLAGCESVRKTGSEGNTFHEGININKGLLCLGQVINALSSNQKYIPYRQAIITTILKDSLSKKNFITLIACVSSKITDTTETLQTLDFARRVKKIGNKPEAFSMVDHSFKKPLIDTSKYLTPLKPSSSGPLQTSTALRKPIRTPLPPKFPYQMNILEESSVSISPIVRRCVAEIESKFVSTINDFLTEQAQKLVRRSPRIPNLRRKLDNYNDENSHDSNFKKFKPDVSKSEPFKDLSVNNLTGSMEETQIVFNERKNIDVNKSSNSPIFKVPFQPTRRMTRNASKLQKTSSPILTNEYNEFAKTLGTETRDSTSSVLSASQISPIMSVSLRRSRRISKKPNRLIMGEVVNKSNVNESKVNKSKVNNSKVNKSKRNVQNNKSGLNVIKKGNKVVNHNDRILEILNEGTLKTLMTLHTIGVKTAEQILLYRQLRGKFNTIEDIKNVLKKGKSFERFLEANFLT